MLIAQISERHSQEGGKDTELDQDERHLAVCVQTLNRLAPRPDLVVITGDLTEHGRKQEYLLLKPLLAELDIPYLLIPGNHDSPAMLREVFHEHAYLQTSSPFIQYAIDDWPLRIVRSEEHTSELQSLMRISYAVFCLKKKKKNNTH